MTDLIKTNQFRHYASLCEDNDKCPICLQARVKELEGQKELIASDLWAQEQESKRMWEYINDHVHSFIDSDEGGKLLSYHEWKELGSNPIKRGAKL